MKAMCPDCGGKGCPQCKDGQVDVGLAEGTCFTRHCRACGKDNGGIIVGPDSPLKEFPTWKPDACVFCRSFEMEWKNLGEMAIEHTYFVFVADCCEELCDFTSFSSEEELLQWIREHMKDNSQFKPTDYSVVEGKDISSKIAELV